MSEPPAVEDWIDLHGYLPREIPSVASEYVEAAARRGFHEVRLVHGRGKGVQRRRVQQMLEAHWLVLGFRDAPAARGGWGATIAWLRPVDPRGRAACVWQAPRDQAEYRDGFHRLLEHALAQASSVHFATREGSPTLLRIQLRPPFIRRIHAADGESVLAELERELGAPNRRFGSRRRWGAVQRFSSFFVEYPLSERARRYLGSRELPEDWDQYAGVPEDPSLLDAHGEALLEVVSHEAETIVHLTRAEYETLAQQGTRFVTLERR